LDILALSGVKELFFGDESVKEFFVC